MELKVRDARAIGLASIAFGGSLGSSAENSRVFKAEIGTASKAKAKAIGIRICLGSGTGRLSRARFRSTGSAW